MTAATILIVDDHPVVRQGIRQLLSTHDGFEVVAEAEAPADAVAAYEEHKPDVTLLDIRLRGGSGLDVLDSILEADAEARVLMLSSFDDDEYVMRSLRAGAFGYLLKGDSDTILVTAVETVAGGRHALSPQVTDQILEQLFGTAATEPGMTETDLQMLRLLAEGASNSAIAGELFMSDTTVKRRLRQVFAKLGVGSRTEAAAEAARRGLV